MLPTEKMPLTPYEIACENTPYAKAERKRFASLGMRYLGMMELIRQRKYAELARKARATAWEDEFENTSAI